MKYLRLELNNIQPVRIADNSTSQQGQTDTLHYIPGATIRGMLIAAFAKREDFTNKWREVLLSNRVSFGNAYLAVGLKTGQEWKLNPLFQRGEKQILEFLPSFHGFYEEKADEEKRIYSVLAGNQDNLEGKKRAGIGRYCAVDGECVYYQNPLFGEALNIDLTKEEKNIFRSSYLEKNQTFVGYISADDEAVLKEIQKELKKIRCTLGNRVSSGYGRCDCKADLVSSPAYMQMGAKTDIEKSCYLYLYSDMVMLGDAGEVVGVNWKSLEQAMGVKNLKGDTASTSVVSICGYNRMWGGRTPTISMYQKGSIFKLTFEGCLKKETIEKMQAAGIGVRRNEGFGRILFLDKEQYQKLVRKEHIEESCIERGRLDSNEVRHLSLEEKETLQIIRNGYIQNLISLHMPELVIEEAEKLKKIRLRTSQLGKIQQICQRYIFDSDRAWKELNAYAEGAGERDNRNRQHNETRQTQKRSQFFEWMHEIDEKDYKELFHLSNEKLEWFGGSEQVLEDREIKKYKLDFIEEVIQYYMRGEKQDA